MNHDEHIQRTTGRRQPCCVSLAWAVKLRYIKRGYMWRNKNGPVWIPWTLDLSGEGWREVSPVHFCPFCGTNLDSTED
jgi:hypothetical protein